MQLGLQFEERHDISANGTILIVGKIIEARIQDEVIQPDGYVDLEKAGTLTVSGLDAYFKPTGLGRKAYARP